MQVSSSEGVANHTVPESWRRVHGVRLVAAVDLARVGYDRGPDVTGQSTGLPAGGGSQERTRLRNPGLFRAILEGSKLVFGTENHEESQPWLLID